MVLSTMLIQMLYAWLYLNTMPLKQNKQKVRLQLDLTESLLKKASRHLYTRR